MHDTSDTDALLVSRAREGDMDALDILVRRHQSWVFNLALRMVWRREAAEDATQESTGNIPYAFVHCDWRIVVSTAERRQGARTISRSIAASLAQDSYDARRMMRGSEP